MLRKAAEPEESTSALAAIDFRYSPLSWQTAYCFPDDHYKSLIGERGELRYGHPGQGGGIANFPEVVEFSLRGDGSERGGRAAAGSSRRSHHSHPHLTVRKPICTSRRLPPGATAKAASTM